MFAYNSDDYWQLLRYQSKWYEVNFKINSKSNEAIFPARKQFLLWTFFEFLEFP